MDLPQKEALCKIMFEEVIKTISQVSLIEKIVIVSKDEEALKLSKQYQAIQIVDDEESGVNHAVSLADSYLQNNECDASIVFPQDIPLIQSDDIYNLIQFYKKPKSVLVVPSQRFDGTNALFRFPQNLMETHYDEDSYKIHLEVGRSLTPNTSLVLLRRIMQDVDTPEDLEFLLSQNEKPSIREKIQELI